MDAERWDEQVGSVADEAARLLESLRRSSEAAPREQAPDSRDRAADTDDPIAEGEDPAPQRGQPASGPHDPFCTWCPLCRTAEVVRSLSPETITRLADLASLAATVLADMASARSSPTRTPAAGPADADEPRAGQRAPTARRPTPSPIRPIPVRDADEPQESPHG